VMCEGCAVRFCRACYNANRYEENEDYFCDGCV
jgi:hypothetical protein